ncbi:unnamed protein product [Urochloa humidicola]
MEAGAGTGTGRDAAPTPPTLPWSVRLQLFGLVAAAGATMRRDGTVNRFVFKLLDRPVRASARPDKRFGVRSADVVVDASRGLWARVFSPSEPASAAAALPVLVYFHGGAFALLSAASPAYDAMCRRFCRELDAVVVSVNYRLAPEHRHPAAYDDGVDVLRHLASNGLPDLAVPVDLSRCFLAGDSAGGNIAHHVARLWTATLPPPTPPSNPIRLAGIILVQPYFGGEERTEAEVSMDGKVPVVTVRGSDWAWRAFLPVGSTRDHPAAHVTDENAGLAEGFPPAMVVVGGLDPLQDWQRRYADVLRRKGKAVRVVEFPEAIHAFFLFPVLPDSGRLVAEMKAFMDESETNSSELTA